MAFTKFIMLYPIVKLDTYQTQVHIVMYSAIPIYYVIKLPDVLNPIL